MSENTNKKIIAITRPFTRVNEAKEIIEKNGAEVFVAPTLKLKIVNSPSLKKMIKNLDDLDWIIFTSPTTIDSIFNFYPDFKDKVNKKTKIAAIGTKTKEAVEKQGLKIDLVPEKFTAEGLIEKFEEIDIKNKKIGIPRTLDARLILPEKLKEMGADIQVAEAYKSVLPQDIVRIEVLIAKILNNEIDAITFTSPLTVKNLFKVVTDSQKEELINKLSTSILTVSIGPITHQTLNEYKITNIYPNRYTIKDMLTVLFDNL